MPQIIEKNSAYRARTRNTANGTEKRNRLLYIVVLALALLLRFASTTKEILVDAPSLAYIPGPEDGETFLACEKFHKPHKPLTFSVLGQMNSDLHTYKDSVEQLMLSGSTKQVLNGKPEHAAVLFELFFKHAKRFVKIFCQRLDKRVFDRPEVIEAAADAVKRGVAVDIIVQRTPESERFVHRLEALDEKESIRLELLGLSKTHTPLSVLEVNFAVMDDRAYRLEPDSSELKATACMNDPKLAIQLAKSFNLIRSAVA